MQFRTCIMALLSLALFSVLQGTGREINGDDLTPQQIKFFETKIRPVLVKNCYKCHSAKSGKAEGGLTLDTREAIQAGGESGHGIVPGDIGSSLVVDAMSYGSFEMPPKRQLPESVVNDFKKWVRMGAPDPRNGKAVVRNDAKIDFVEGKKFWAFQKITKPNLPQKKTTDWGSNEIDQLVLAKLNEKNLKPVTRANEETLLRRDYINLIGLPPSPSEIKEYLNDTSADKREKLIDRLLKSPQFGERWGRHWLDVARFAESNGRERNFLFPHAWRYRNYVIDSFNQDKPFDRFITEQIAGDLIQPKPGQDKNETLVATGFLAIGPKTLNERNREIFAMDVVDEQIDVVCRSTMAITVACARCHDHKFDPVATEDYYALAGIFRSTETLFGKGGNGSRQATGLINVSTNDAAQDTAAKQHQARIDSLQKKVRELNAQIKNLQKKPKGKQAKAKQKNNQLAKLRRTQKQTQQQLSQLRKSGPTSNDVAMGVKEGNCKNCNVLIRGEVTGKGPMVKRGFLQVLSRDERALVSNTGQSGRLELANWIVSKENPLTARVTVNRIWRHLLGQGIVRTVDNFGFTGDKPTHPELLDYLAAQFVENGWSFKSLIREIMLSETYQLSCDFKQSNYDADPDNQFLWRMNLRRMDAEVIRDSVLKASAALNLKRPETSMVARYKSSQGVGRGVTEETFNAPSVHRSVYLPVVRNAVPETLRLFDFAEPSMLVGARQITNVPAQALFMMNSPFIVEHSQKLVDRIDQPGNNLDKKVELAYLAVLTRMPTKKELDHSRSFIQSISEKLSQQVAAKEVNQSPPKNSGRNNRKQNNRGSQKTNAAKRNPDKLALAAFCQALFASSEFRILK